MIKFAIILLSKLSRVFALTLFEGNGGQIVAVILIFLLKWGTVKTFHVLSWSINVAPAIC